MLKKYKSQKNVLCDIFLAYKIIKAAKYYEKAIEANPKNPYLRIRVDSNVVLNLLLIVLKFQHLYSFLGFHTKEYGTVYEFIEQTLLLKIRGEIKSNESTKKLYNSLKKML